MNKFKLLPLVFSIALLFVSAQLSFAADKIRIVTTTSTIADLTRQVVGEKADIHYVAPPKQNIHFISPTPKDVLKVKKADVFIHGGLDLEAWRDPLLNAAGNTAFLGNGKASIDVFKEVVLLEVPTSFSRSDGDIHVYGNPHYWVDPQNALTMIDNIVSGLSELYPQDADEFRRNADQYKQKLTTKIGEWDKRMAPYKGETLVAYHKSWPYFAKHFGFNVIDQLEPKPGIPPTSKHIAAVENEMKEHHTKIIIKEIYNESRTPGKVANETGATVVTLETAPGERKDTPDYISMMEHNVSELEAVFPKKASQS